MKKLTLFSTAFFLSIISVRLSAQSKIHGSVINENGEPFIAATVLLINSTDSILVKGTVTNNTGNYFFENIAAGKYFITSSSTGYTPFSTTTFEVLRENKNIDKGILRLEPMSSSLSNVTVVAKRPLYEQKPDRLIINVENSITSAGNTALQVLERSPGVAVNRQNGTISILGKNGVNIMINGKQSYMPLAAVVQMLDGMSAGNIEKIELITTPPANFDAEGNAGFINIVLKQNDNFGTNGSFSGTLGYGKGWNTQASLNLNYRKGKVNLYGDFSYSRIKKPFPVVAYSKISDNGDIHEIESTIDRTDTTRQHNARLGLDYQLNSRTVVGVLFTSNGRWYKQSETGLASFYLNNKTDTVVTTANNEFNNWQDYGINFNMQHSFKKGDNLSFNAQYLHYKNDQPVNYYSRYHDKTGLFIYDETTRSGKVTVIDLWVGALDYSKKLSKKITMDAGIKATLASFTNDISYETLVQNNWVKDPSLSALYTLEEDYTAAYTSLDIAASEKTTIKGGLRYEYTNSNLGTESEKNIVDRHYGKLFPTFFLSQKLDEKNSINFSYNSRITRPTFNDLAPFTYYSTRNSILTGNPALQPAISHAVKVEWTFKKYLLWVAFTKEDHTITNFQPRVDSVINKTINMPQNLDNQKLVSAMISIPVTVKKWWSMQFNITGIWQQVNALYNEEPIRIEGQNININMIQTFTLPKDFSIELKGFYQSPNLDGITVFRSMGSLDLGARKKLGTKDALYFSASNLLNSMDYRVYTDMPERNLVGDIHLIFSWRTFNLTYTRSFGKKKLPANRNRTTGAEDEKNRVRY